MAHLAANPHLAAQEPVPVEIGGHAGLQVDVTASVGEDCISPTTYLWALPVVTDFHLDDGEQARIIALDADGRTIVVVIEAYPDVGDYPALLESAMAVVESIEIAPVEG